MTFAYVLVSTLPMKENSVEDELKRKNYVLEVHPLFGEFDVITKIKADNFNKITEHALDIRKIDGVASTMTLTCYTL